MTCEGITASFFDTPVDRAGTESVKWDVREGELPMWVADMDFRTAPAVIETIVQRAQHGVYGYNIIPDSWYEAYRNWWGERHHLEIEKDSLLFCTGVIPAISSAVRKLTTPAEKVLIQSPVYNHFFHCILQNGRQVIDSPLVYDGMTFEIDWADLERKLADPQTTMMILCNPHNPVGRIWPADSLARIGGLCKKYHVTVISDEIHCDITSPGTEYIPFASVNDTCREISITCITPTKAFNVAGIQTAAVVAYDEVLRNKMRSALSTDEVGMPGTFSVDTAVACFTKGGEWLDAMRAYVEENKRLAAEFIKKEVPSVKVMPSEATYLLWLDCRAVTEDSRALAKYIREQTGLFLSDGAQYGGSGVSFLRMNVACPRSYVQDGLERLKAAVSGL